MTLPFTLTDLPRPVSLDLYNRTREEVRRKYRQTPGVVEVLEFGLIPLPGVSDMDFFVLTEPGKRVEFPRTRSYESDQRWAMLHMHFAVSADVWTELRCFDPWLMQIVPLLHPDGPHGMDGVKTHTEEERHALSYDHVMVNWLFAATEEIAKITCTGEVHCREFLEMIKGTEYCHRELKRAGATDQAGAPYTEMFTTLRKEWFSIPEKDREARIRETFEKYKETISLLLTILTNHLSKVVKTTHPGTDLRPHTPKQRRLLKQFPRSLIVEIDGSTFVYREGRTDSELRYDSWKSPLTPRRYGHGTYVFPLALSATQNAYLLRSGIVSDRYRACCATDLDAIPVLDHPILLHRADVMNRTVQDTVHVTGAKQPIMTYGAELPFHPHGGTLRARLGGMYDRMMQGLHGSAMEGVVKMERATVTL